MSGGVFIIVDAIYFYSGLSSCKSCNKVYGSLQMIRLRLGGEPWPAKIFQKFNFEEPLVVLWSGKAFFFQIGLCAAGDLVPQVALCAFLSQSALSSAYAHYSFSLYRIRI